MLAALDPIPNWLPIFGVDVAAADCVEAEVVAVVVAVPLVNDIAVELTVAMPLAVEEQTTADGTVTPNVLQYLVA